MKKKYMTMLELTLLVRAEDFKKSRFLESLVIEHAYIENYLQRRLEMFLADPKRDLPAKTHYHKIELAYKVGLISARFCEDLHSIRLIRNNFVHTDLEEHDEKGYAKLTFDVEKVSKFINALTTSLAGFLRRFEYVKKKYPKTPLGDILMIMVAMQYELRNPSLKPPAKILEVVKEKLYAYDIDDNTFLLFSNDV